METTDDKVKSILREAFQALLKGNTKERDRLCAKAEMLIKSEEMRAKSEAVNKILTTVDFFVDKKGIVIKTTGLYAAAN